MAKAPAPEVCPGCGKEFLENPWPFPGAQADWAYVNGMKFHGHGCVKTYHDNIAKLEATLEKNVGAK